MATHQIHRDEERDYLQKMQTNISPVAMRALSAIAAALNLDYGGIDFSLAGDGAILLSEANATMVINLPAPNPIWAYRRPAIDAALTATRAMLDARLAVARAA